MATDEVVRLAGLREDAATAYAIERTSKNEARKIDKNEREKKRRAMETAAEKAVRLTGLNDHHAAHRIPRSKKLTAREMAKAKGEALLELERAKYTGDNPPPPVS